MAGALALGLVLATGPILFTPQTAKAGQTSVQKMKIVRLDKTLRELDKATETYRGGEHFPNAGNKQRYSIAATIPGEMTAIVALGSDVKRLVVTFPKTRDVDPTSKGAGIRGLILDQFAKAVEEQTGQKLERVKIVLETGTFEHKGQEQSYTNIYLLPVDAEGKITSSMGKGQYVTFVASYHGNKVLGAISVLAEPHDRPTMEVAALGH
jgi:hypothetical protein